MKRIIAGGAGVMLAALCLSVAQPAWRPALAAPIDRVGAPSRLSETGLYVRHSTLVDSGNREFMPQYPLWSDGLVKRRWVYLPPGMAIDGSDEHEWQFPVGTRFWKEFSLNGRRIETRMLWKTSETAWIAASYAWNEDGTDAVLAPDEGVPGVVEVAPGKRHSIPSRTDCTACHGAPPRGPLGFNALQLSTDRDPNAIHGEPLPVGAITLKTLVEEKWLLHSRADLMSDPPRIRTADPATRAVLGYLSANCGMCHNGRGEIAVPGPVVRLRDLLTDADAVAKQMIGQQTAWQIAGEPEGTSQLVKAGAPDASALFLRMRSRSPSSQMPPLGTIVRDEQAVDAVRLWIAHRQDSR